MLRAIEWILLGTAGCTAIVAGVRRYRPDRSGPWLLLAGALATVAAGDACWAVGRRGLAEFWYYAMFVLVAVALLQLTRVGAILADRARLIDLLACTCSALLVVWVFVIGGTGRLGRISAADLIGALVLVAVCARLWFAAGRNTSAMLLTVGAVGVLGSDIAYPLWPGEAAETGYVLLYLAWGAAALHPSMTRLTRPAPVRATPWQGRWTALLGVSVATPPVVLFVESLSGTVRDGVVIAVIGAVTLLLAITRLADALAQTSRALNRECGLREASAALVAAADLPAVDDAVRAAAGQLMPAHALRGIVFATDDRQSTGPALDPSSTEILPSPRSWWTDDTPPAVTASRPAAGGGGSSRRRRAVRPPGPSRDVTLVCPLWLEPLAVARPNGGALILTGRRDVLTATRDALEVLAGQAALALDRIALVEAVGRRDSDLYLRTVISNTADAMLVIDSDQRIRYASPALRDLVGLAELPPLATLQDLVQPDDRSQVRHALQGTGDGVIYCALHRADGSQVLVEATYRDLRGDRLVQGFVVTLRDVGHDPVERVPHTEHVDALPGWVNRRSARHKFRY